MGGGLGANWGWIGFRQWFSLDYPSCQVQRRQRAHVPLSIECCSSVSLLLVLLLLSVCLVLQYHAAAQRALKGFLHLTCPCFCLLLHRYTELGLAWLGCADHAPTYSKVLERPHHHHILGWLHCWLSRPVNLLAEPVSKCLGAGAHRIRSMTLTVSWTVNFSTISAELLCTGGNLVFILYRLRSGGNWTYPNNALFQF